MHELEDVFSINKSVWTYLLKIKNLIKNLLKIKKLKTLMKNLHFMSEYLDPAPVGIDTICPEPPPAYVAFHYPFNVNWNE